MPSTDVHSQFLKEIIIKHPQDTYASSIRALRDAGIQMDKKNYQGKTAVDILRDRGVKRESLNIPPGLLL